MASEIDFQNLITIQTANISVSELMNQILNLYITVAGAIAFIYLIYAGILYITSGNNPDQAKKAQSAFINVIIGVIIITLSYIIIRLAGNIVTIIVR